MSDKQNEKREIRRLKRCRKKYSTQMHRPRIVIFKSAKHIYAQLVDNIEMKVLLGVSSLSPELREKKTGLKKTEVAKLVGMLIAEKAKSKGHSEIIFDRHGFMYHGRVKALAEGAREGGLIF